jgi:hypothetical protein
MSDTPIKVKFWCYYIDEHPDFTGCLIDEDDDIAWYKNGKEHREDGPAIEWANGSKSWWLNGTRHRTDGPAIEWTDDYKDCKEWWLNGKELTEQEHRIAVRQIKLKLLDTDQHSL